MLRNGTIAVKKLNNSLEMHEDNFKQEVTCLMGVNHKNIVRFLGYCSDTQGKMSDYKGKLVMADERQRMLCFEYLPKGCLHNYITGSNVSFHISDLC
jgi:coatomer subunit beta'